VVVPTQRIGVLLLASAALLACGEPDCTDSAMIDGAGGLVLTAEEHPDGWGREACESCHATESIHRSGCSTGVNYEDVNDLVAAEGNAACATCHGDNGVTE